MVGAGPDVGEGSRMRRWRVPRRFSLSLLLLGMTALCVLLAIHASAQRRANAAIAAVDALGGMAWGEPVWTERLLNWLCPSWEEWEVDLGIVGAPNTVYFHKDDWFPTPDPAPNFDYSYMFLMTEDLDDQGLSRLVHVVQHSGTIRNLTLEGVSITDQGGRRLGELRRLHSLVLSGTALGDETAEALANCSQLESLSLDETQVSKAALERLRAALPHCKISWSPPPAPKPHR